MRGVGGRGKQSGSCNGEKRRAGERGRLLSVTHDGTAICPSGGEEAVTPRLKCGSAVC